MNDNNIHNAALAYMSAATAATLVGKGFAMSTEYPELVSDTVQRCNITIKLSDSVGTTTNAITFTKET